MFELAWTKIFKSFSNHFTLRKLFSNKFQIVRKKFENLVVDFKSSQGAENQLYSTSFSATNPEVSMWFSIGILMIAFGMTGAEQQDRLSAGYGVAFTPKGQIVFGIDRMDLLLQVPMLDLSPQMELGQILQPLGFWCDPGK